MALGCCLLILSNSKLNVTLNLNSFLVVLTQFEKSLRTAHLLLCCFFVVSKSESGIWLASKTFFVQTVFHELTEFE